MKVSMKAMRVNAKLSQEQAAEALGITKRTLQNWENYETFPTAIQFSQLCNAYGCTMDDIFLPECSALSE